MKSERIDRPYMIYVVDCLTVAFESILLSLNLRARIKIFDSYPSLD